MSVATPLNMTQDKMRLLFGDIVEVSKSKQTNKVTMSGYVSTLNPDLTDEIIKPEAFNKHIKAYQDNPIYCFNHEREMPIGIVNNVVIDQKGLYLDGIELVDEYPFVKQYVIPMLMAGVLKQQSIGFLSLKGRMTASNMYEHLDVYVLESSLVSVACNPNAVLDFVGYKAFKMYNDIETFADAYNKGLVTIDKNFYVSGFADDNKTEDEETIMEKRVDDQTTNKAIEGIATFCAVVDTDLDSYDPEGEVISKPSSASKNYNKSMQLINLVQGTLNEDAFALEFGNLTKSGFSIDFNKLAKSLVRLLGARGGISILPTDKGLVVDRVAELYKLLNKKLPTHESTPINECDFTKGIRFQDIEFHNEEDVIFEKSQLEQDLINVVKTLKRMPNALEDCSELKYISPYLNLSVYAVPETQEEVDLITRLSTAIVDYYKLLRGEADDYESVFNSIDGVITEMKSLVNEDRTTEETETTEVNEEASLNMKALRDAIENYKKSCR